MAETNYVRCGSHCKHPAYTKEDVDTLLNNRYTKEEIDELVPKKTDLEEYAKVGTVLYYNGDGTNGTVELTDSVENYDYLEVYYFGGTQDHDSGSTKIYSAQYKRFLLPCTVIYGDSIWFRYSSYWATGKLLQLRYNFNWYFTETGTVVHYEENQTNYAYIYRVVGYKCENEEV